MVRYMNIPVFTGTKQQLLTQLSAVMQSSRGMKIVFTPNPEQVMLARRNPAFLNYLQQSDINIPDGIGLVWATRVLFGEEGAQERISGRELMLDLVKLAQTQKASLFFLGGSLGTAKELEVQLNHRYPGVSCVSDPGALDIQHETKAEEKRVLQEIKKTVPTILCVAYGAPYQEKWVIDHRTMLEKSGVKIVLVVGGAFDVLTGNIAPAPNVYAKQHLEWFWRLQQEPWRWKRQLALVQFVTLTIREKLRRFLK